MSLWLPGKRATVSPFKILLVVIIQRFLIYGSEEYINVAGTAEICNNEVDDDGDGLDDFDDDDCQYPANGTIVTVQGRIYEWYSLAELKNTTVTVTGTQASH